MYIVVTSRSPAPHSSQDLAAVLVRDGSNSVPASCHEPASISAKRRHQLATNESVTVRERRRRQPVPDLHVPATACARSPLVRTSQCPRPGRERTSEPCSQDRSASGTSATHWPARPVDARHSVVGSSASNVLRVSGVTASELPSYRQSARQRVVGRQSGVYLAARLRRRPT